MKIKLSDPEIIRKREMDLIDAIVGGLDWSALVSVFKERHRLKTVTGVESRNGDIVVSNGAVAYRLDFDVKTTLSVLFDRSGHCLELNGAGADVDRPDPVGPGVPSGQQIDPLKIKREVVPSPSPEPSADSPDSSSPGDLASVAYASLDEILTETPDSVSDASPLPKKAEPRQPGETMTRMASELAELISEINGNGKKE
jgi:hypothetical protein